jgi:hypothetical protein
VIRHEGHGRLRGDDAEAEAFLQIEIDALCVMALVADGDVLARLEEKVAAAHADDAAP